MLVELERAAFAAPDENAILARCGATLVNKRGASGDELSWLRRTFSPLWAKEAAVSWNWFAIDGAGQTLGFASYEQRTYRFWWLKNWLAHPDVGIFGPMGVGPAMRGKQLGRLLAHRTLSSIRALGYKRAVIPHAGPIEFYERCCGARIAERLKFLGLF